MKKTLVYMIVLEKDTILCPPLGDNSDCDFVVFTTVSGLASEYWDVRFDENICSSLKEVIEQPKNFISGYEEYIYVECNQIICGSLSKDITNLITVPTIGSLLPESMPLIEPVFEEVLPNPTYTDGAFNGYPLQLSICLPISNRKDTLHKCLEGLKPLLDNLKSELIVVDSSNDGSREVAESYGAKIIPYTWKNDFADARNTAIRAAKGSWIFSIDDDEWFESVDEIIKFFKGKQCNACDSASYTVRNYTDPEGKTYNDFYAQRMAKNHPDLHYVNVLHESLDFSYLDRPPVAKYFSNFAHHFGYAYKTEMERESKIYRNISGMYTAIKASPLDLRLYLQLCTELTSLREFTSATAFCFKLLSFCKLQAKCQPFQSHHWKCITMVFLYTAAQIVRDETLFKRIYDLTVFEELNCFQHGCIDYFLTSHAFNNSMHEEVCKYANEYYSLRKEYLAAPSKPTLATSISVDLVEPTRRYNTVLILHAFSLMSLDRLKECASIVSKIDFNHIDDNDKNFVGIVLYKLPTKDFIKFFPKADDQIIESLYRHAKQLYDKSLKPSTGLIAVATGDFKDLAGKVSASCCFMDNSYVRMIQLYGNPSNLDTYGWFCEDQARMETSLEDVCLPAALNGYDLRNFTSKLKLEGIQQMIRSLSAASKDEFIQIFDNYVQNAAENGDFDGFSLEEIYLFTGFLESHLLNMADTEFEAVQDRYPEFFTCYIRLLNKWTHFNYNQNIFEAKNFSLLPATSRGAIYMAKALETASGKDERISHVKSAVSQCPLFDKGAKLLLAEIVKCAPVSADKPVVVQDGSASKPKTEFEILGEQLKGTAKQLLDSGKFSEAQNILIQLSALLPSDLEIKELLARCEGSNLVN